ncbi:MAG: hypothetical protein COC01_01600 [Bacteroidetes bacterium]|nr:MAG: hypothetical protein COC01_01600 [Bacteroidota bacterium]
MNILKKPLNFLFIGYLMLLLFSCKKEYISEVPEKSRFTLEGDEYVTTFGVFELIDTTAENENFPYVLNLFSSEISYFPINNAFYGQGELIKFNLNTSVFNDDQMSSFKIDNLKEGLIEIKGGEIFRNYSFALNTGQNYTITSGTLIIWKFDGKYKFNYKIETIDNIIVEGAFWDPLSVVFK